MALGPAEVAHGPMFIGGVLTILSFGISVTQTYIYWSTYRQRDRWFIKYFVALMFVADTVHTVGIVVYLYICLIKHFDDPVYLTTSTTAFEMEPALSGMISGMVQAFFGWRVKVLTGSWALFIVVELCSIAAFLMGIATALACHIVKFFADFQKFRTIVIIWLACATFADILITGSLVTHLRKHRTGFQHTDSHIDRIIRLTVQTGLITAIWAFADLLVYLLDPTGMHLLLNCLLPKLYTNSLLSSLNSRGGWKFNDSDSLSTSGKRSNANDIHLRRFGGASEVVNLSQSRPEVFVHVESQEISDAVAHKSNDAFQSEWNDRKDDGLHAV
ncbi:hypothetical protein BDZ89DRAFT_392024 [Hymenopellis radicata]|nr:hypothetical protein BDZ89DRAFT_392024 [Hymenopellis radicata]